MPACVCAQSGTYPDRPLRFVVPFVAGTCTDMTARAVAQKLTENLGHQVGVDNRPGAAGNMGMELTAKSAPDGYTIVPDLPTVAEAAVCRVSTSGAGAACSLPPKRRNRSSLF